ncbi:MAG: hypothetical protein QOH21_463, partial [Acidobacteriota bacterium]|nr:hypothetical protein [Acidobacteriota bacterium]
MRQIGIPTTTWLTNIAATAAGLLLLLFVGRMPRSTRLRTQVTIALAAIATILLAFVSNGMLGVHRWVSLGGFHLQPSAIVAPLIIACITAIAPSRAASAFAIAALTTIILALQPDAAQTTSFAAACSVIVAFDIQTSRPQKAIGITILLAAAAISFTQLDPLAPVQHVEEIYGLVASKGAAWAAVGATALLLLPLPFVVVFLQTREPVTLALAVY